MLVEWNTDVLNNSAQVLKSFSSVEKTRLDSGIDTGHCEGLFYYANSYPGEVHWSREIEQVLVVTWDIRRLRTAVASVINTIGSRNGLQQERVVQDRGSHWAYMVVRWFV